MANILLLWVPWTCSFLYIANTLLMYSYGSLAHFLRFLLKCHITCRVHLPKLSPSMIIQYKRETLHPHLVLLHIPFSSVQSLSRVRLFATPWIAARQASLSITNSRSLFKLMSIELVMPSSHLILCRPLLLLPPIPPSIRVFSNESTLHMRWPK